MESNGPKGHRSLTISAFAPAANHAILNHLRGRHSQVAKATVCKVFSSDFRRFEAGPGSSVAAT
jgi:hypothetical protein